MTRPTDTWRVCGQPVTVPERLDQKGRGCNCRGHELSNPKAVIAVLARLDGPPPTGDRPPAA